MTTSNQHDDEEPNETAFVLSILHESFPGRSDKQLIPIGMVYAGTRWGRDFRFCEVPEINDKQLTVCNSEEDADFYFSWLADHLYTLDGQPNEAQQLLCKLVKGMTPQDAALMLGMHAALYQLEIETMEVKLEKNCKFEEYLKEEKELMTDEELEDLDEEKQHDLYRQVAEETEEWLDLAPGIGHVDVPWRMPLAVALKKAGEDQQERIELLNIFYGSFFQYIEGIGGKADSVDVE
jgi:hypothetical protein